MVVSVHQPQYIPWLGFFDKIDKSDVFVFLDNVQYKKREFQNRNKIRTKNGWMWLTVPVISKGRYTQKIKDVQIDNTADWPITHLKSIKLNYCRAKFFKKYFDFFQGVFNKRWVKLIDLNIYIIKHLLDFLGIKKEIFLESGLKINSEKTQRIIDICKKLNADTYLSGQGAKEYLEESLFVKNKIKLVYQEFLHPEYNQLFNPFIRNLSVIDLLFNCGNDSLEIIRRIK